MTDRKRILVTGGAGYIGSHTCKALDAAGYTPVVFDDLSNGHAEAVQWGPLVRGDNVLNDVGSRVLDRQIDQTHPVKVATGNIQHRPD